MTAATSITVRVPLKIRRRSGRKTMVTPVPVGGDNTTMPTRTDSALVKALARAFRYQKLLDEGRFASISEMAAAERIERGYLGSLLRLTLLEPRAVESLLSGTQLTGLSLRSLLDGFSIDWDAQRVAFSELRS